MERLLGRLSSVTVAISGLFLFAMMIHVTADVAMKYAINKPIPGTLEVVSVYYMVGGVFLPLIAVELYREAIAVDVAYQFMPRAMKAFCMVLVLGVSALFYAVMARSTFFDALKSYKINEQLQAQIDILVWPSKFVLPISFAAACAICLMQLYLFAVSSSERAKLIGFHDVEENF